MHRFWDTFLEPLCRIVAPRSIVEVGAGAGLNTSHILDWCRRAGARCHVVDPAPRTALEALAPGPSELVERHRRPSLEVLPEIDGDLYLLDGDHNWYTVSSELEAIAARAAARAAALPVVCLHDVGWPYGRRDLYYEPARIPAAARQPHARRGMALDTTELLAAGGYNHLYENALREGGERNGVLTAAEDFVAARSGSWRLAVVEGFHGLGVLWAPGSLGAEVSRRIGELLESGDTVRRHLRALERARLELLVRCREMDRLTGGPPGRVVSWIARAARRLGGGGDAS